MKNSKEDNLADGVLEAISVLTTDGIKKKSRDNGEVNLLSIVNKVKKNRKKQEEK